MLSGGGQGYLVDGKVLGRFLWVACCLNEYFLSRRIVLNLERWILESQLMDAEGQVRSRRYLRMLFQILCRCTNPRTNYVCLRILFSKSTHQSASFVGCSFPTIGIVIKGYEHPQYLNLIYI